MMIKLCEICCSDIATTSGESVYETFQKQWQVREVWVNPAHVVSIVEFDPAPDVLAQLPKDLVVTAGFSSVVMNDGRLGAGFKLVGSPQYIAEKLITKALPSGF